MLAPEELASLRGVATDSLEDVCTVTRITRVRQPNNSWKDVEGNVYVGILCRKVPSDRTPQELAISDTQLGNRALSMFRLEGDKILYRDDVVVHEGDKYPVAGVLTRTDQIYMNVYVYDDNKPPTA